MKKSQKIKFNALYIIIQVLYLASFCALATYASVYLVEQGFSLPVVGTILAISNILNVIVQPLSASFIDKHKEITIQTITIVVALVTAVLATITYFVNHIPWLSCILFIFLNLASGIFGPIISSLAFLFEKDGIDINYGLARAAGSGSYALAALLMGSYIEKLGTKTMFITYAVILALLALTVSFFKIKDNGEATQSEVDESNTSFVEFMKKYPAFMMIFVGICLVLYAQSALETYLFDLTKDFGGNTADLGKAFSLAAAVEIPGMIFFESLSKKFSVEKVMIFSLVMYVVKYALTLMAKSMTMIYVAQCLQMLSYALFTPGTVYIAKLCVEKKDIIKAQTFVNMPVTIAIVAASFIGGFALEIMSIRMFILISTFVEIIGAILIGIAMAKDKDKYNI